MLNLDPLARQPSAKRVLKRIRELEPYAAIEKPDANGGPAAWIFIHRKHWAGELVVSTRTISRSLQILEGVGHIERQQAFQSRGYGREVHVCLTDKGRAAAERLGSSKLPPGQVKADKVTAASCHAGCSKLPPRQHISEQDETGVTERQEEKEIPLHSPDGDCRFGEEGKFQRRTEREKAEENELEVQLEARFRRCFKAAFPEFRVPVATQTASRLIVDLAGEVLAGEWTLTEIEETWSRIFPMWWRFVTDVPVQTFDRRRPDRFSAVTYLSQMHNYLLDHARMLEEEADLGPLAPSALRRAVIIAHEEAGGGRNLPFRDPDDATSQLYTMAQYFRDHDVTSEESIRFVVRVASYFGQAGLEGHKYWTPAYANLGSNARGYLSAAGRECRDAAIKAYARDCVREFASRVSPLFGAADHVDKLLNEEMDAATQVATRISLGNGKGDPISLFSKEFCPGIDVVAN